MLPFDFRHRVALDPLKGAGAKEQQTKHTFASLRGRSCQEVRGIAASFGIKKAGGHRGARETYKKDDLIQQILDFQAASVASASSSSSLSLLSIFAAQRQRQAEATLPALLAADAFEEPAGGTASKPASRHQKHYAKTRQQKVQERRDAAKKFYLKKGRILKNEKYSRGGKERYQQQGDKLREGARRFYKEKARSVKLDRYAGGGKAAAR